MFEFDQDEARASHPAQQDTVKSLSRIVEQEARRFFGEAQIKPDPSLVAAGWNPRFIADARQAREAMELYRQLGFEVRAEPVPVEQLGDQCSDCQVLILLQFKAIYTRKKR